jgi:uncharacterized membrane protein
MMMTKEHFLSMLDTELAPLPPEEREELMEDYRAHFMFGLQNGKTEAEIITELGDPHEIAQEALQQRVDTPPLDEKPVYWYYRQTEVDEAQPQIPGHQDEGAPTGADESYLPPQKARQRSIAGSAFVIIGLLLLNLVALPLLVALWSAVAGIAAGGAGGVLSPVLALLDFLNSPSFYPAKGYASVSLVGVGILLLIATKFLSIGLYQITAQYAEWNIRTARGGVKHD